MINKIMKKYDIFLFDADGTLYDFDKASAYALEVLFNKHNLRYSDDIPQRFIEVGAGLWASYEAGKISDKELQKLRFSRLFDELGIQNDPYAFNGDYMYELGKNAFLIDGALEICQKITSNGKKIFIITNSFSKTCEARAKHSPIECYISGCFVSEAIGYKKPDREYFKHVFSGIPPVSKEQILVVGDSLSADIAGGNVVGVDTCWLNLHGVENHTGIVPTYEICKLSEVERFV